MGTSAPSAEGVASRAMRRVTPADVADWRRALAGARPLSGRPRTRSRPSRSCEYWPPARASIAQLERASPASTAGSVPGCTSKSRSGGWRRTLWDSAPCAQPCAGQHPRSIRTRSSAIGSRDSRVGWYPGAGGSLHRCQVGVPCVGCQPAGGGSSPIQKLPPALTLKIRWQTLFSGARAFSTFIA